MTRISYSTGYNEPSFYGTRPARATARTRRSPIYDALGADFGGRYGGESPIRGYGAFTNIPQGTIDTPRQGIYPFAPGGQDNARPPLRPILPFAPGTPPPGTFDTDTQPPPANPVPPQPPGTPATAAGIDYSGDPILQKIRALSQQSLAEARGGAGQIAKEAAIGYGGVDLPQGIEETLSFRNPVTGADEPYANPIVSALRDLSTRQAAEQNPFSTQAQLRYGHERRGRTIEQALAPQNLLYSSTRATQLGEEGRQYQLEQAQAAASFRDVIAQAIAGLLGAQRGESQRLLDAEAAAYERAARNQPPGAPPGGTPPPGGPPPPGAPGPIVPPPSETPPIVPPIVPPPSAGPLAPDLFAPLAQADLADLLFPPKNPPSPTLLKALAAAGSRRRATLGDLLG